MNLTLNIVYTPGTAAMLSFMVRSLLYFSDCSYRIVANGCLPPERRFLQKLAAGDPRLEFIDLPTDVMWQHGRVLNYLQQQTTEDYFGFLDSDIFATGDFLLELTDHLNNCAAVFTGAPVWAKRADQVMPQHFQIVSGPHNRTDLGLHIGGTYFAVYDNNVLTEVMNADGVGFDTSTWEHVRQEWRDPLARVGLAKQGYDTGKLLNAMLIAHGHTLHYADAPALVHLGGTSFVPLQPQHKRWWEDLPGVTVLRRWRSQWAIHDHFSRRSAAPEEVKAKTNLRLEQRNIVRSYFWHALQSLAAGQPLPALPQSGDLEILDRLSDAAARLEQTYRRFGIQTATDVVTESSILA